MGDDDLRDLQALVARLWTAESRWHVGDVAWDYHLAADPAAAYRFGRWERAGRLAGWGWAERPGSLELCVGFGITAAGAEDAERRAALHRAGWADFGSRLSGTQYAALMRTHPYRPETDLVVVAPDGTWVASALGWYDEVNGVGLVEPVSCIPDHRGRGLSRAVNVALLHAFRELGAGAAVVLPRGDDAYPAPGRLYRSIGYQPGTRTVTYWR